MIASFLSRVWKNKNYRSCVAAVGMLAVSGVIFILYTNLTILSYRKNIIFDASFIPTTTVVMVFGGGMKDDGSVSDMAGERLKVGIYLYKIGKAQTMLITGDDGQFRLNEVDEMKRVAVKGGVAVDDIIVDRHGYRTYESCARAHDIYHLKKIVAVSQVFHLPRIAFLCEHFDVEVIGAPAEFHIDAYSWTRNTIREILSRTKNWVDTILWPPSPPAVKTRYIF